MRAHRAGQEGSRAGRQDHRTGSDGPRTAGLALDPGRACDGAVVGEEFEGRRMVEQADAGPFERTTQDMQRIGADEAAEPRARIGPGVPAEAERLQGRIGPVRLRIDAFDMDEVVETLGGIVAGLHDAATLCLGGIRGDRVAADIGGGDDPGGPGPALFDQDDLRPGGTGGEGRPAACKAAADHENVGFQNKIGAAVRVQIGGECGFGHGGPPQAALVGAAGRAGSRSGRPARQPLARAKWPRNPEATIEASVRPGSRSASGET